MCPFDTEGPLIAGPMLTWANTAPVRASSAYSTPSLLATSVGIHALGHLLTAGFVAFLVYEKLGVAILRRAWINVDLLWTVALMATGAFILLL